MAKSQKEQGLRNRIGTEKLIGCYTIDKDGSRKFTDIRGEEGDCVVIPGVDELSIEYNGAGLKENQFYAFNWYKESPVSTPIHQWQRSSPRYI